jgi:hypothetical protein
LPQAPSREEANEEDEAHDVSLNFYEFLEELDAAQEGDVPLADLQAAIDASFETQHQERGVSRAAQRESMAPQHPPPSPAALLHQEMIRGRAERRQAIVDCIVWREQAIASKEATGNEAGSSSAQPAPPRNDDDHLF